MHCALDGASTHSIIGHTRLIMTDPIATAPKPEGAPTTRLNKRMAQLGLCSRREADEWIERGLVHVNGKLAVMGLQVAADAQITVDRKAKGEQEQRVTVLLNKPIGYVSAQAEDGHEPAVALFQPANRWAEDRNPMRFSPAQLRGLAPAGRLDIDSTGLLVLTQDGRVARHLIGEDSNIEKEYLVRVVMVTGQDGVPYTPASQDGESPNGAGQAPMPHAGALAKPNPMAQFPSEQLERLRHGLELDGKALRPAKVSWQNEDQLRIVLREGKKRQIRRMCEMVGLSVVGLKRVRIGSVVLGRLPVRQWRYLGPFERF